MDPDRLAICQLPEEWKGEAICSMYKKCDYLEYENFRAITILDAAYKVLSQIIFRRLSPVVNEFVGSYQASFVDGRSTTDHCTANPLKMSWIPGFNASPFHRFQGGIRQYRPRSAMENNRGEHLYREAHKANKSNDRGCAK